MHLQFVGCGDAFGSGGRFNTCFHVAGEGINALIDCGASSSVALNRLAIDRNAVDTILFTHFHADHFGGLPFLMMDAMLVSKRTRPLTLIGPPGLAQRYAAAMDVAFPSSPQAPQRFSLTFAELEIGRPTAIAGMRVTAFPVVHVEAAGPCVGYRIEVSDRVLAYSGDTEWTESLVEIGRNADLFVCECYTYQRAVRSHTSFAELDRNVGRIAPKKLVLTHMSDDMLAHVADVPYQSAADGLTVGF